MKRINAGRATKVLGISAIALGVMVGMGAQGAKAATSADSGVTLTMDNFAAISATATATLTPSQADFEADNIVQTGALTLGVLTNDTSGCTVSVSAAASPTLNNADLLIKSGTSGTVSNFESYRAVSNSSQDLWVIAAASPTTTNIVLDMKVENLRANYPGGSGGSGSTANYTNILTFTVLPNA